jgi:hypothetical protein
MQPFVRFLGRNSSLVDLFHFDPTLKFHRLVSVEILCRNHSMEINMLSKGDNSQIFPIEIHIVSSRLLIKRILTIQVRFGGESKY